MITEIKGIRSKITVSWCLALLWTPESVVSTFASIIILEYLGGLLAAFMSHEVVLASNSVR
ncbi:MAG: hypothetical protein ACFFDT_07180 [Candidatus Hodarchaeota archaeon]